VFCIYYNKIISTGFITNLRQAPDLCILHTSDGNILDTSGTENTNITFNIFQ